MGAAPGAKQEDSGWEWAGGWGSHHDVGVHVFPQFPGPQHTKFGWQELGHPKISTCPEGQLSLLIFSFLLFWKSPQIAVSLPKALCLSLGEGQVYISCFDLVLNNCPSDIGCCVLGFLPHRHPKLQEIQRGLNRNADHWLDSSNLICWFATALLKIITILWFAWSHCLHGKHFLVGECTRLGNLEIIFQSKQLPNEILLVNLLRDPINFIILLFFSVKDAR